MLIAFLITASIFSSIYISIINKDLDNKRIVVKVENKIVKEISVNKSTPSKTYEFDFGTNKGYVEIKDGKARMLKMDKNICPQRICSDTGWISKKYETIVCLPNRIVVGIEQSGEDNIDVTTY